MCSLQRGLFRPGWMYLSANHVCFSSKMLKEKIVIPFSQITSIEKHDTNMMFDGIMIKTRNGETFEFGMFVQRNQTYSVLQQLWNLAMERALRRAESTVQGEKTPRLSSDSGSGDDTTPRNVPRGKSFSNGGRDDSGLTFKDLGDMKRNKRFQALFKMQESETLKHCFNTVLYCKHTKSSGWLFVSSNFVCFHSVDAPTVQVIVPLRDVTSVEYSQPIATDYYDYGDEFVRLVANTHTFHFQFPKDLRERIQKEITTLWKIANLRTYNIHPLLAPFPDNKLKQWRLLEPIVEDFNKIEDKKVGKWENHFNEYGFGVSMLKNKSFRSLVRDGIPDTWRGLIWQISCGSIYIKMLKEQDNYYANILEKNKGQTSQATEEIDKDIHRSLPEHPYFQNEEGILALQRVLTAYSWHNPTVGYCQSMNIVAAMLLLTMTEESAFYTMITICEILMPQYYNRLMIGSIVDQGIFEDLIAEKLPVLSKHLNRLEVPIAPITMPWFLLLYVGVLPVDASLRVLDNFFVNGVKFLFKIGLALMKLNQKQLLQIDEGGQLAQMLKEKFAFADANELIKVALEEFSDLPMDKLQEKRAAHKYQAILNLERSNKQTVISVLREKTKFTKEELEHMYQKFKDLKVQDEVASIHFEQFEALLFQYFPFWREALPNVGEMMYRYLGKEADDTIEWVDMISGLDPLSKGDLSIQLKTCIKIITERDDEQVNFEEFKKVLTLLVRLHTEANDQDIEAFAMMVFDKLGTFVDGVVSASGIQEEIISKPLLVEFFQLKKYMLTRTKSGSDSGSRPLKGSLGWMP
jgi:hypothetical protein